MLLVLAAGSRTIKLILCDAVSGNSISSYSVVVYTPGSAFGPSGEGYVRMALVQSEEDMQRIVEAVKQSGIFQ